MNQINYLIEQSSTANPYKYGTFEVWNRIKWDINPESWRSREIIKKLKNKYVGQKAVIICNGPSLLKTDLNLIKNTFTFGLNKIYLLFDKSDFRPSCIVATNPYVIEQSKDFYNSTNIPLFLNSSLSKLVNSRDNVAFLHLTTQSKFVKDCSVSIQEGYTVTFVAMQLAFHMGFSEIALVGCDHNFSTKGPANLLVTSGERDDNHFDPKYFSEGAKWQLPDLVKSEMFYCLAKDVFEAYGRKIFNCTEGGNLEVYPRVDLRSWIENSKVRQN